eukprot:TRINITY_DN9129_c0_g1_i1.p1 TRINITY_DN9129_c0_g1~~TRINITY_DN9129_c0_g1_i1.p1  ORF type:complete len:852 (+),score=218.42 TRINITY_DN9129_c0_g1_i1:24-2579(+)
MEVEDISDSSSSNSSSSSGSEGEQGGPNELVELRIKFLKNELAGNPNDFKNTMELIKSLKQMPDSKQEIRSLREKLSAAFALPITTWLSWINDEQGAASSEEDKKFVSSLYQRATADFSSVELWERWLLWEQQIFLDSESTDIGSLRRLFDSAIGKAGHHVRGGIKLWVSIIDFEKERLEDLSGQAKSQQETRIRSLYRRVLVLPLLEIDQVMEDYKQWEASLGDAKKECDFLPSHEAALRKVESRKKFEEVISDTVNEYGNADENQLENWLEYIEYENNKGTVAQAQSIYERTLCNYFTEVGIWKRYIAYIAEKFPNLPSTVLAVITRAVRNCPTVALWKQNLIFLEKAKASLDDINEVFQKSIQTYMSSEEYLEVFELYLDIRVRDFKKVLEGTDDEPKLKSLEDLRGIYQWSVEYFNLYSLTAQSTAIQIHWAKVEAYIVRSQETSDQLFEGLLKIQSKSLALWKEAIASQSFLGSYNVCRNLFKRACNIVAPEDFEELAQTWVSFERLYGSLDTWEESQKRIENRRAELKEVLKKQQEKERKENEASTKTKGTKRKAEPKEKPQKKKQRTDDPFAKKSYFDQLNERKMTVEGEQSGRPPLGPEKTRQYDPFVLHVGNLPEGVAEEAIKNIFQEFGVVLDVRLLFTSSGRFKGFAYVQFEKAEDAAKAIERETAASEDPSQAMMCGDSILKVQYALALRGGKKPTKFELAPLHEDVSTLFVVNLAFRATEEDIAEFFGQHAPVKEVRIVRDRATGRSRGFCYVDCYSNEDVQKLVNALNGQKFMNLKLQVQASKPPPGAAPTQRVKKVVDPVPKAAPTPATPAPADGEAPPKKRMMPRSVKTAGIVKK